MCYLYSYTSKTVFVLIVPFVPNEILLKSIFCNLLDYYLYSSRQLQEFYLLTDRPYLK